MSGLSPFFHYRRERQLLEVGVDDVKVLLPESDKIAIGTQALNGCTCVVILGTTAILLAHISPLPGRSADWERVSEAARHRAGYDHHQNFLQTIENLVRQNARHFPPPDTAWGIFAVDPDQRPLQNVVQQIETHLTTIGFGFRKAFYKEIDPNDVKSPKGELVGVRRSSGPRLYLERSQLWPKPQETTTTSAESAPSSSRSQTQAPAPAAVQTQSSYWAWSGAQRRWAFIVQGQGQRPQSEWPQPQGRTHVFCTDDRTWKWYDFSTKAWIGE